LKEEADPTAQKQRRQAEHAAALDEIVPGDRVGRLVMLSK